MRYLATLVFNFHYEKKYYAIYLIKIETSLYKVLIGTNKKNALITNMPITSIKEACQLINMRFKQYPCVNILFKKRFAKYVGE